MKHLLVALTVLMSLPLQAKTVCRVKIEGQNAKRIESPVKGSIAFSAADTTVIAQPEVDQPNRMRFTVLRSTKAAYVVAAFRDDRLQLRPEINGQQMALSCLRK